MNKRFGKSYKLCSRKAMDLLFAEKEIQLNQYPFRLLAKKMELPTTEKFQIGFSVPKRLFKKAPDRNKIKRLMREVVRKNKACLEQPLAVQNKQLALFLIYTGKEILNFNEFEDKILAILQRLSNEISK
jgi:ribonuclease P protein component